jgi:coenzyme PQQ biosynthesis protein B
MPGVQDRPQRTSRTPGGTQASIAVSADGEHWFLINASPDPAPPIGTATPQLHPKAGQLRHSPIAGVILTNGEIDAVAGLFVDARGIALHPLCAMNGCLRSSNPTASLMC